MAEDVKKGARITGADREKLAGELTRKSSDGGDTTLSLAGQSDELSHEDSAQAASAEMELALPLDAEIMARLEIIDKELSTESDAVTKAVLVAEAQGLVAAMADTTLFNDSARLTNVRNNFALGSYYDAVNIKVNDGK